MTKHTKNIKGQKFNYLTVIKFDTVKGNGGHAYWICKCVCGKKLSIRGGHLRDGSTKSCGCKDAERASKWLKEYATSDKHKGKGNPMWVGDEAKYSTKHSWLLNHNDKKDKCEHCGKKKKLDWALKKGKKYSRDIKDYLCLCRSCHLKYDYTDKRRKFMGKMLTKSRMDAVKRREDFQIELYETRS